MSSAEDAFRGAVADLAAEGARFALVGGLALAVRVEPRFTKDVDVAIAVADDRAAEALVAALRGRGYVATTILDHEVTGGSRPRGSRVTVLRRSSTCCSPPRASNPKSSRPPSRLRPFQD